MKNTHKNLSTLWVRTGNGEEVQGGLVAQQMFEALHGLKTKLSFEIVNTDGSIRFLVTCPANAVDKVRRRVHAAYPKAEVLDIEDCLEFPARYAATEYKLTFADVAPIKRYMQFSSRYSGEELDPLADLIETLSSRYRADDRFALQLVVTPKPQLSKWRRRGVLCTRVLTSGLFTNRLRLQRAFVHVYMTRIWWLWPLRFVLSTWANLRYLTKMREPKRQQSELLSAEHRSEDMYTAMMDKLNKAAFDVSLRAIYLGAGGLGKLRELDSPLGQLAMPHLNGIRAGLLATEKSRRGRALARAIRKREHKRSFVLNSEELATLYHFPYAVHSPHVDRLESRILSPPDSLPCPTDPDVLQIGITSFRGQQKGVGLYLEDRMRHLYIIGKTGMGKSTLLENLVHQDLVAGRGVALLDPHGDLAAAAERLVPRRRVHDVILLDPTDTEGPVGFNPLANVAPAQRALVADGVVEVFKHLYADAWGPRLENILRNAILALVEHGGATLIWLQRMLRAGETAFRERIVRKVEDPMVRAFWEHEFEPLSDAKKREWTASVLNKVEAFLANPALRNILGQQRPRLNLREVMDNGKVLIVNLSKGQLGDLSANLLGSLLVTQLQLAAMSRASVPMKKRRDFFLYVDEFQNFATTSFASILSEARKYRLGLTLAHQYMSQVEEAVRDAVIGNAGSFVVFQVGKDDAACLSKQLEAEPEVLQSTPRYQAQARLLVHGLPRRTFTVSALPPPRPRRGSRTHVVLRRLSREKYGVRSAEIEHKLRKFAGNR